MNKILILSLLVLALAYFYYKINKPKPKLGKIISTGSGQVEGIISLSRDGREFNEWLGIPYAQPPIGQLRFKSPQPIKKWEGILDGSKYGAKCAQLALFSWSFVGSEDCLFVNIHAPKLENQDKLLPVLVFIHGGGFWSMAGDEYTPEFFMDEDVILVTINYRLSILGFLNAGDKSIRGNMGLKDQVEALKWLNQNVKNFGGDPQRVTIFGESAGGSAIHYLLLAENKTRGLFQKAIAMSGTALTPWAYSNSKDSIEKSKFLASQLNCPTENGQKMAECLQKLEARDLLKVVVPEMNKMSTFTPHTKGDFLRPALESVDDDEAFLTLPPYEILTQGKASRVPFMVGVCANEGMYQSLAFYNHEGSMDTFEKNWDDFVPFQFGLSLTFPQMEAQEKARKLRNFYFPPKNDLNFDQKVVKYTEFFGDGYFNMGTNEVVTIQKKNSPMYTYLYNRPGGPSMAKLVAEFKWRYPFLIELAIYLGKCFWSQWILREEPKDYGHSGHAQDMPMFFPMATLFPESIKRDPNNLDYKFSKDLIKLWVQFASDEKTMEFRGTKLSVTEKEGPIKYFQLSEKPIIVKEPFEDRFKLWKSINFENVYNKK